VQTIIQRRLVRAGISERDREDFQQTVTEALLYMADPPKDLEGCSKAANDITSKQIAGARRRAIRRGAVNVGLTDEADHHAQQEARELANGHHAQRVATVREAMTDGTLTERDAQMLKMKREGLTDAQIAEKIGIATRTVSNRIATARKKMRQNWQARLAGIAALTIAVVIIVLVSRPDKEVAKPPPERPDNTAPSKPPLAPEERKHIADLRTTGHAKALEKDWKARWEAYFEAEQLDTEGTPQDALDEASMCKREVDKAQKEGPR
jgi:DNA-binding CsgD family transcriptional regulator